MSRRIPALPRAVPGFLPCLALLLAVTSVVPASAQPAKKPAAPAAAQAGGAAAQKNAAFAGLGSNSKAPIQIDADRLEVFDRENRAVYMGNVVAVQGDTTMRCSKLTIFFDRSRNASGPQVAAAPGAQAGASQQDAVRRIECAGPVTVVSKDQVATGKSAVYERDSARVTLEGDVKLTQGENVIAGDQLVYDVDAGEARFVNKGGGGRVRSLIVPGSAQEPGKPPR